MWLKMVCIYQDGYEVIYEDKHHQTFMKLYTYTNLRLCLDIRSTTTRISLFKASASRRGDEKDGSRRSVVV